AAVISDAYWDRKFQRSRAAVGSTLLVEGLPATIVGVTPLGFTGADVGQVADLTLPFQLLAHLSRDRQGLLQAGKQFHRMPALPARSLSVDQARARLKGDLACHGTGLRQLTHPAKTPRGHARLNP